MCFHDGCRVTPLARSLDPICLRQCRSVHFGSLVPSRRRNLHGKTFGSEVFCFDQTGGRGSDIVEVSHFVQSGIARWQYADQEQGRKYARNDPDHRFGVVSGRRSADVESQPLLGIFPERGVGFAPRHCGDNGTAWAVLTVVTLIHPQGSLLTPKPRHPRFSAGVKTSLS